MKKLTALGLSTAMAVVGAPAATAQASELGRTPGPPPVTLAVFGDTPYGTTPTDTAQFAASPAFLDSINADPDVSLAMHVGDIHSGKQFCTEAYDRSIAE